MGDNEDSDVSHITFLPDELISSILSYNDIQDVVNFSSTCKRFYELLGDNNSLWKQKYNVAIPGDFQSIVSQAKEEVDWLHEVRQFFLLKKSIVKELVQMSAQYYWRDTEISLEDIKSFFKIATSTYINYYYTIFILQEIVRKTRKFIEDFTCSKPVNTLTCTYYAKRVLRYLIQTYLCIKWARGVANSELSPEVVVNYFIQWIDPDNLHFDEDVDEKIEYLASESKKFLSDQNKVKNKANKPNSEREILLAISETIYKAHKISPSSLDTGSSTLDIVKVVDKKHGCVIALGAIYQAVARKLGAHCELNAFSNHFFLEWLSDDDKRMYTIDLTNGELRLKRQCPFSQPNGPGQKYNPSSFINFIFYAYMRSKGNVHDWEFENAAHLLDFLSSHEAENYEHNPYKDFYAFLVRYAAAPALRSKINIKNIDEENRHLVLMLSEINPPQRSCEEKVVKKRIPELKYAVGMVCYHIQYYYMCVICGWEVEDSRKPRVEEPHTGKQPIYTVLTEDQSVRFIPQEKICQLTQPMRVKSIEDLLGRDFTHFDGYAYVSNDEKLQEYPEDRCIVEEYINHRFTVRK
ncbi:uncharacterized protein LOC121732096 [Aricia agestis]|uniref:uncharacterized protein LOC121732096 n=1 Tax=Aricia agestis TaxID=91739 RepID=UPI001C202CB8|nr:uncharacterized protein LOC121732096 [Aricia agestis]